MYSKIQLHLSSANSAALSPVLSFQHYLAEIELYEFRVCRETEIYFAAETPTFFMYAILYDNSCSICYGNSDNFVRRIPIGLHKILIVAFEYHWMVYKLKRIDPINLLAALPIQGEEPQIRLPILNMASIVFRSFLKISSAVDESKRDDLGYAFINGCINKYYNRLISQKNTQLFHANKAEKVREFIHENFNKCVADDLPKLAEKFSLSERTLARIAKLAFGIPLHEQVIKLRITAGREELAGTNKPINEIARQLGYNDPHYFSKAFKKYFGISPSSIRDPEYLRL